MPKVTIIEDLTQDTVMQYLDSLISNPPTTHSKEAEHLGLDVEPIGWLGVKNTKVELNVVDILAVVTNRRALKRLNRLERVERMLERMIDIHTMKEQAEIDAHHDLLSQYYAIRKRLVDMRILDRTPYRETADDLGMVLCSVQGAKL